MSATNWLRRASGLYLPGFAGVSRFGLGCTCCGSCTIFSDDFTRADSANIGSDWTETAGDWSIASNKLSIASDSATATGTTSHSSSAISVSASVSASASGGKVRIYIGSNYAEATFSGGSGSININGATALPSKATVTLTAGTEYTLIMCITAGGILSAQINNVSVDAVVTPASSGVSFAVGTGTLSSGTATFDNFVVNKVEAGCSSCTTCDKCIDGIAPDQFQMTVSNWAASGFGSCSGGCSVLNGTFLLDYVGKRYGVDLLSGGAAGIGYESPTFSACGHTFYYRLLFCTSDSSTLWQAQLFDVTAGNQATVSNCSSCSNLTNPNGSYSTPVDCTTYTGTVTNVPGSVIPPGTPSLSSVCWGGAGNITVSIAAV